MLGTMPIYIGAYYSTSKAALDHYTKAAAMRLAPKGIRVNSVSAGHIDTPFLGPNRTTAPQGFIDAYKQDLNDRTAMGRAASPREINSLVEFLSSDAASFITGSIVVADGGFLCGVLPPKPAKSG
jgi:NAD(P)-dependent dehydrogenase (short-subunit alcohol dehydrogenase family)